MMVTDGEGEEEEEVPPVIVLGSVEDSFEFQGSDTIQRLNIFMYINFKSNIELDIYKIALKKPSLSKLMIPKDKRANLRDKYKELI